MKSARHKLLNSAKVKGYKVVSCYDFFDIGDYKTVNKALERLVATGELRRLCKGLYGICDRKVLRSEQRCFSDDQISSALSRKYGWVIAPDGASAANSLGLAPRNNHVETTYVSNGPYKRYEINGRSICFKRQCGRYLEKLSPLTLLYVEAMKKVGNSKLSNGDLKSSVERLGKRERALLSKEKNETPPWIRKRLAEVLSSISLENE